MKKSGREKQGDDQRKKETPERVPELNRRLN